MKRYVKASRGNIVYKTASGKCKVRRVDVGDTFYDVYAIDRRGEQYIETFEDLDAAIDYADDWEARYQQGLNKQPEFDEWYQSLSPDVKKDFDDYDSGYMSRMDIRNDYEAMVEYLDYIDSGRKYKWNRR